MIDIADKYADDIISGKISACKWTKLACERYFLDLEHGKERGLWFDKEAANHRISFYKYCKHSIGSDWAGKPIQPEPWQVFIQWNVFGWKREDGYRRFRTIYEEVARKNGKSTDLGTTGLYLAFFDGEEGAQVYTIATKYEQACIIHSASTNMVKASPDLQRIIKIFKNNLSNEQHSQKYIPLGQDSGTSDGLNPHAGLVDEYHAFPTSALYDVVRSGQGSRRQPMMFTITTAGFEKNYPCYEMQGMSKQILDGSIVNDAVFPIIYTLDEDDDFQDKRLWVKANPNLNVSVFETDIAEQMEIAIALPSKLNEFLTKRMNIWTEAQTRWITSEKWKLNNGPVNPDALIGRPAYAGLDLSSGIDLTAWVLCFPPIVIGGKYEFLFRFFLPADNMHERELREKVQYSTWVRNGLITTTPGDIIDYSYIYKTIISDVKKYAIKEIAFDRWGSNDIVPRLTDEIGNIFVDFGQGFRSMSPASRDFERKVMMGDLATNGNPVMDWMISCTELATDAAGNVKPIKPDRIKTGKHIDGVVASIMALSRAIAATETKSVYESRGVLLL